MGLRWTRAAYEDLRRIHEFLAPIDPAGATRAVRTVMARVRRVPAHPRLGQRLAGFGDREVRRVLVQNYEVRYEISGAHLYVLRVFHAREDR